MTEHTNTTPSKKGCGPVLVVMIASFFMVIGLLAGAGGLYGYLYTADGAVEKLGIATPAVVTEVEPAPEVDNFYALAYPIMESIEVPDSLDEAEIRDHISRQRDLFKECYLEELERSPDTRGEIAFQFSVHGSTGDVFAASSRINHTGSETLSDCIAFHIRRQWEFTPPESSAVAVVRFHTLFLPLRPEES